jgi:hypothetical protein
MPWTDLGTIGSANTKTAGNTIAFNITQALSVGDFVTLQVATDNAANTTGATTTHSSITAGSNTFVKVAERTIGGGGVASGTTLSVWRCVITSAMASNATITANFTFSPAAKVISGRRFTVPSGATLSYPTAQVSNITGTPASLTVSGLVSTREIFAQRAAALESTSASISTQTTNWTLGADVGTSGGSAATNMSTRSEYLLTSGVTSVTSAPTGNSGDSVSILFVVEADVPISLNALTWGSGGSVAENSANSTSVGTVAGKTSGSTVTLQDNAGGRFNINTETGNIIVADGTLLDYETNTSHNITVRETLTGASNTPRDTVLTVTITNVAEALPWKPSNLSTVPVHWFDAQDAATITTVSGFVSQWNDKGTQRSNATQTTAGNRPEYIASSNIGSKPALRTTGANGKGMVVTWNMAPLTVAGNDLQLNTTLTNMFCINIASGSVFTALSTASIVEVTWTTTTMTFYQNGVQVANITGQTLSAAGSIFTVVRANSTGGGTFGRIVGENRIFNRSFDDARAWDGDIGEIVYLPYVPTQTEREKIEGYMAHRWALAGSLNVAHPYKSAAPTVPFRPATGYAFILG